MSDLPHPILIVTGMHRSGTSLTASLLQSAGVNMGENLMPPSEGNVKGHFEDLDIVQFHENALKANHLSPEGWTMINQVNYIPEDLKLIAKEVISKKRNQANITGWKDPRGTLFLNFWESELPEAKFIFLYRNPWEVIDSLYRRGDTIFQESPRLALDCWLNYNAAIIDFYDRYPEQSLLFDIDRIRHNPQVLNQGILEKFSFSITPDYQIYDSFLFHDQVSKSEYPALIREFFTKVTQTEQQIRKRCYFPNQQQNYLLTQPNFHKNFLLKQWLQLRTAERKFSTLYSELQRVQEEKEMIALNYQKLNDELKQVLYNKNKEIEKIKTDKECLETVLENTQLKYEKALQGWEEIQNTVQAMKSSKFWKLRKIWFLLKARLGLPIQ